MRWFESSHPSHFLSQLQNKAELTEVAVFLKLFILNRTIHPELLVPKLTGIHRAK